MSGSGRKHSSKRDLRDEPEFERCSRSRSPANGFRWDSGFNERKRMRPGGSTKPCRDFAVGKCRRGSHCHFLHDDNYIYEDGWESRHREDGPPGYSAPRESGDYSIRIRRSNEACTHFAKGWCRMGASCKFAHHDSSDGVGESTREREFDRRRMGNTLERGGGHGPNNSADIPCKFFAFGNCRNGNRCRFSHDRQACKSPDRRSRDDMLRGVQGGDLAMDIPKLNSPIDPDERLEDYRRGSGSNIADVDQVCDSPKQSDLVAVFDTVKRVRDSRNETMSAPTPEFTGWPYCVGWDHSFDKNRVHGESPFSGDKKETNCLDLENAGGLNTGMWPGDETMSPDWNHGVRSSCHIEEKNEQNKQQVPPGQELNQNAQNPIALHSSSGHVVGQSQVLLSVIPSRAGSIEGVQNQEISTEKKHSVEPNIIKPNLLQVGSRNPSAQSMASTEQLAQLSSISASLVHILGSVRQLPPLHATLNSHGAKDTPSLGKTEGSSKPLLPTLIKSDPSVGLLKRHDPICAIIEPKNSNASVVHRYFSPIKKITDDAPEIPSLLSNSGRQNLDDSCKPAVSENLEVKKEKEVVVTEERKNSQCANEITKEDSPSENVDLKDEPDESKKTKDAKCIRAFKYSLVEFVKELLKPTWKDGKINKDDYKSIVKKVADKVTSTVQRAHIPQTQDKIDHYLSLSKPKLSKLLQAYVDKVQKA